jgi:WD40 repeat protein
MKERIWLQTKRGRFTLHLLLALLFGVMLSIVMMQAPSARAEKYSDWSAAVNLGPAINSAFSDQGPAISKDGLSLYFRSSGRLGGSV